MANPVSFTVSLADNLLARLHHRIFRSKQSLIVMVFHGVVPDHGCERGGMFDGGLVLTLAQVTRVIEYLLNAGCVPVGPKQILGGLDSHKTHFMLTFDDGYFNNTLVLPLLERYKVPAQFALIGYSTSTGHSFWWDAITRVGSSERENLSALVQRYSKSTMPQVEEELVSRFGPRITQPVGDIDRPLSPAEARQLAKHPLITIANHSQNHRILAGLSEDEIEQELGEAQATLQSHLGFAPEVVVYPYGQMDDAVTRVTRRMGFVLGFAGNHAKVGLPFNTSSELALRIPRFSIYGNKPIEPQCWNTLISWKLSWTLKGLFAREHKFGIQVLES